MKRFRFKLESYLKLQQIEEKKRLAELAVVAGEVSKQQNEIKRYYQESDLWLSKTATLKVDGVLTHGQLEERRMLYSYLEQLKKKSIIAERKMEELRDQLKQKQDAVVQARKKRRTIEIIKEKKWDEYREGLRKEEQANLDEFNQSYQGFRRSTNEADR